MAYWRPMSETPPRQEWVWLAHQTPEDPENEWEMQRCYLLDEWVDSERKPIKFKPTHWRPDFFRRMGEKIRPPNG